MVKHRRADIQSHRQTRLRNYFSSEYSALELLHVGARALNKFTFYLLTYLPYLKTYSLLYTLSGGLYRVGQLK